MVDRVLGWSGCTNVRDLGGLALNTGGTTRRGIVVRADCVTRLDDAGRRAMRAHGVRRIVDLRTPGEVDPAEKPPAGIDLVPVPILPGGPADPRWAEFEAVFDAAPNPTAGLRDVYLAFLEQWPEAFTKAIAAVLAPTSGAVVVQCQAGRDRTGLVVALLLDACDVTRTAIADDYALTSASGSDPAPEARVMTQVLATVDRQFGGARQYLLAGGLDPADLDAGAARLLP